MKHQLLSVMLFMAALTTTAGVPDSVYVRPYSNNKGDGLRLDWSANQKSWQSVYNGIILSSDYGPWGSGKKLFAPSLTKGYKGEYVLVFQVNGKGDVNQFGVSLTNDFVHWRPQDYPYMKGLKQCINPIVSLYQGGYKVTFECEGKTYSTTSKDMIHFSEPKQDVKGTQVDTRIAYAAVEGINAAKSLQNANNAKYNESAADDAKRFEGLKEVSANIQVDGNKTKQISDKLMGIFFEDINYSADGGLYAELIQNRDFEYNKHDHGSWNSQTAWTLKGDGGSYTIETSDPIHANNSHYAVIDVKNAGGVELQNEGFDGICVKKGDKLDLSAFLKQMDGKSAKVKFILKDGDKVIGRAALTANAGSWKLVKATLTASADCDKAVLSIEPTVAGRLAVDFVSLFPQNTFKGRKNGMRKDLAETLYAMHPRFMRFPGGCASHGNGLANIYHWKETIGPMWERKSQPNIWGYHQSRGLGYYEYFQFCEDMQMEPLPVLAAGVPCQNSSWGGNGQQGGIPMADMPAYVQEVLDLIEWANGDAKTTEWGRKRAEQGHPKPFNLHYIGIGNEDLISPTFEERYLMIVKAVKNKYPEITVCGTVGPFFEGSDYEEGWKIATENHIDMVDEHYYVAPGWYLHHQDFYDQYDRTAPKVYLGEWAAHIKGRKSTIETALACAIHYCGLERNGDIVAMSSYAPLLAKEGHTQWNPDMIYFNNKEVKPTVDYWTQQMCGAYAGDTYLSSTISADANHSGLNERLAVSTVKDSKTGKIYLKVVSMLPLEVKARLVLSDLGLKNDTKCTAHVLKGDYNSTKAKPIDTEFNLSSDCQLTLAPYSFTVIEIAQTRK